MKILLLFFEFLKINSSLNFNRKLFNKEIFSSFNSLFLSFLNSDNRLLEEDYLNTEDLNIQELELITKNLFAEWWKEVNSSEKVSKDLKNLEKTIPEENFSVNFLPWINLFLFEKIDLLGIQGEKIGVESGVFDKIEIGVSDIGKGGDLGDLDKKLGINRGIDLVGVRGLIRDEVLGVSGGSEVEGFIDRGEVIGGMELVEVDRELVKEVVGKGIDLLGIQGEKMGVESGVFDKIEIGVSDIGKGGDLGDLVGDIVEVFRSGIEVKVDKELVKEVSGRNSGGGIDLGDVKGLIRDKVIEIGSGAKVEGFGVIRIKDKELGEIKIEIKLANEEVRIVSKVERLDVLQEFRNSITEIRKELEEIGFKLKEFQVFLGTKFEYNTPERSFYFKKGKENMNKKIFSLNPVSEIEEYQEMFEERKNLKGNFYFIV